MTGLEPARSRSFASWSPGVRPADASTRKRVASASLTANAPLERPTGQFTSSESVTRSEMTLEDPPGCMVTP